MNYKIKQVLLEPTIKDKTISEHYYVDNAFPLSQLIRISCFKISDSLWWNEKGNLSSSL